MCTHDYVNLVHITYRRPQSYGKAMQLLQLGINKKLQTISNWFIYTVV